MVKALDEGRPRTKKPVVCYELLRPAYKTVSSVSIIRQITSCAAAIPAKAVVGASAHAALRRLVAVDSAANPHVTRVVDVTLDDVHVVLHDDSAPADDEWQRHVKAIAAVLHRTSDYIVIAPGPPPRHEQLEEAGAIWLRATRVPTRSTLLASSTLAVDAAAWSNAAHSRGDADLLQVPQHAAHALVALAAQRAEVAEAIARAYAAAGRVRPLALWTDAEIVCAYLAGSTRAFTELYTRHATTVRRALRQRDPAVVEDVLQQTFLNFHRSRHRLDPSRPVLPWLITIARNVESALRTRTRRITLPSATPEPANLLTPEVYATSRERVEEIEARFYALPTALREAIAGYVDQDGDYEALASSQRITVNAARVRVHRARRLLGG